MTIVQREHKILREIAKPIPINKIKSKEIGAIIEKMKTLMHTEDDAVAIAAPQIGESLRMFIVSGKVFAVEKLNEKDHEEALKAPLPPDQVFINPEIIRRSKKDKTLEEGCLSVRWLYGLVRRAEKVTIRAHDEKGKLITRGASGLLAQVFQHETDHLNGILFTDKAKNIKEIPPQNLHNQG